MMMDAEGAAVEVPVGFAVAMGFLCSVGGGSAATFADAVTVAVLVGGGVTSDAVDPAETGADGAVIAGPAIGAGRGLEIATPTRIAPARSAMPPPAAAQGIHFGFGFGRTRAIRSDPVVGPSVSASGLAERGPDFRSAVMRDRLEKLGWLGGTPPIPTRRTMRSTCERACIGAKSDRSVASSATF